MDNKKLIQLAYDMGAHPYSVGGMVAALQKGIEIGKEEQKAIDIDKACNFFEQYLMDIGYPDDWCRDSEVQKSGEQRFREFMCE